MGIKDRDSVGSQNDETTTNVEQVPVELLPTANTPAIVVPEAVTAPISAGEVSAVAPAPQPLLLSLLTAVLPSSVAVAPVSQEAAVVPDEAPTVCPICESGAPQLEAGVGLSALALVGFLSFYHQNHRKERNKSRV